MLAWPSPTYPQIIDKYVPLVEYPVLLENKSPFEITWDQSAMIAGFLMLGNSVGTLFTSSNYVGSKVGLIIGNSFMVTGWCLMWLAVPIKWILWLLSSRFLVGVGHGFLVGHLKAYISETCDGDLKSLLTKQINLYTFFCIIVMYSCANYINFKNAALVSFIVSVVVLVITFFLPSTSKEPKEERHGLLTTLCDKQIRSKLLKFVFLVFCQQFSGLPATIIYTQILFDQSRCPYPKPFSIFYAIAYFIVNYLGIFVIPKYNKKTILVLSSLSTSLAIILYITLILININDAILNYFSTAVIFIFMTGHTLGLGNIPVTYISEFPTAFHVAVGKIFVILHSMLALLITKIFQVLMTQFNIGIPFCLFLFVSLTASIFVFFYTTSQDNCK